MKPNKQKKQDLLAIRVDENGNLAVSKKRGLKRVQRKDCIAFYDNGWAIHKTGIIVIPI